jgi:hypothetical protein
MLSQQFVQIEEALGCHEGGDGYDGINRQVSHDYLKVCSLYKRWCGILSCALYEQRYYLVESIEISSIFWIWKSADFQEPESYDMLRITHESNYVTIPVKCEPIAAL